MAKGKVEITGLNTNNLKSLSHEENMELFKKMHEGDNTAKEKLVKGNLKLVLSIIKRFSNKVENLDDLFQVGVIGLIKAIDNFDMSYNLKLSTYACPLIIGECKRSIRDSTSLRVSRSIKDLAYQIIRFKDDYAKEHAAFPSNEIIAKNLNIEEYEITYALDALREPSSFYEPVYNEGGDTIYLLDQIADKNNIEKDKDLYISLRKALNDIKKRERDILIERFIIGKTQMEIAKSLNISQAQVSRIEKNAINNVRRLIKWVNKSLHSRLFSLTK